jgi:hypothetical protein
MIPFVNDSDATTSYTITYLNDDKNNTLVQEAFHQSKPTESPYMMPVHPTYAPYGPNMYSTINTEMNPTYAPQQRPFQHHDPGVLHTLMNFSQSFPPSTPYHHQFHPPEYMGYSSMAAVEQRHQMMQMPTPDMQSYTPQDSPFSPSSRASNSSDSSSCDSSPRDTPSPVLSPNDTIELPDPQVSTLIEIKYDQYTNFLSCNHGNHR